MDRFLTFQEVDELLALEKQKKIPPTRNDAPRDYYSIRQKLIMYFDKKSDFYFDKKFNFIEKHVLLKTFKNLPPVQSLTKNKDGSIELTVNGVHGKIKPLLKVYPFLKNHVANRKCYDNAAWTAYLMHKNGIAGDAVCGIKTLNYGGTVGHFANIHCMFRMGNVYLDNATFSIIPVDLYNEIFSYKELTKIPSNIVFWDKCFYLKYCKHQLSENMNPAHYMLARDEYMERVHYSKKHPLPEGQKYKAVTDIPYVKEDVNCI